MREAMRFRTYRDVAKAPCANIVARHPGKKYTGVYWVRPFACLRHEEQPLVSGELYANH